MCVLVYIVCLWTFVAFVVGFSVHPMNEICFVCGADNK